MNTIVCVKRVPDVAEAEIVIDKSGKDIVREDLAFDMNEWDLYALEEAVLLKEKLGGTVTAISLGDEDSDEVLRRALAVGADEALLLSDAALVAGDAHTTAKALAAAIRSLPFDLVLVGAQAADDGCAQVGPTLAEMLGIPHATLVTALEVSGRRARVERELEAGLKEVLDVQLPAVLTIQTGINEPRYVPIAGIRRVARRTIEVRGADDLALGEDECAPNGLRVALEGLSLPTVTPKGEILDGSVDVIADRLVSIFASKGWLA